MDIFFVVKYTGRGLVVKQPGAFSKVQMLNLVLGVEVFPFFQEGALGTWVAFGVCPTLRHVVSEGNEFPVIASKEYKRLTTELAGGFWEVLREGQHAYFDYQKGRRIPALFDSLGFGLALSLLGALSAPRLSWSYLCPPKSHFLRAL